MTVQKLPVSALSLDDPNQRRRLIEVVNQLTEFVPRQGGWTPIVRGSGTAGTYELSTNYSRYTRIGSLVFLDFGVRFAAAITGGGTGDINITGAPFSKKANTFPIGTARTYDVDLSAGTVAINLVFLSAGNDSTLYISETQDNAAPTSTPISGISANDFIFGSICYETDDP